MDLLAWNICKRVELQLVAALADDRNQAPARGVSPLLKMKAQAGRDDRDRGERASENSGDFRGGDLPADQASQLVFFNRGPEHEVAGRAFLVERLFRTDPQRQFCIRGASEIKLRGSLQNALHGGTRSCAAASPFVRAGEQSMERSQSKACANRGFWSRRAQAGRV